MADTGESWSGSYDTPSERLGTPLGVQFPAVDGGVDIKQAYAEFLRLKLKNQSRNVEYYLLRQAVRGEFRWPPTWPDHIEKVSHNICKALVDLLGSYLLGKGFTWSVARPNTLEYREKAERSEKILARILDQSSATLQWDVGSRTTTTLGRAIYKVYRKGTGDNQIAAFSLAQPDYFYGIPSGDPYLNEYSTVYYSYPIDISEAQRKYGMKDFKTEAELARTNFYDVRPEELQFDVGRLQTRRVPVLEVWTKDHYALVVGGVEVFNGKNPFKWKKNGEGFIPFVVIDNLKGPGDTEGVADIQQVRVLNEKYNYALSRENHIVSRWLQPTLVWEGAPSNYAEILAATVGGGGAIPTRLGARLYFLSYDRTEPAVQTLIQGLRQAMLESAGMTEIAMQGVVSGTVNTGPALAARFQPLLARIEKKRREWEHGLENLFAMLLNEQEAIGDSGLLGEAVVGATSKSQANPSGDLTKLSGKDIDGLRSVKIDWPGVLPKDDVQGQQFVLEQLKAGAMSFYTALEKLGEEYPDDEIARIREENTDPTLRGEKVAEQMRAAAPLMQAQTAQAAQQQPQPEEAQDAPAPLPGGQDPNQVNPEDMGPAMTKSDREMQLMHQGDIGARLRELRRRKAKLDTSGDEPVIRSGQPTQAP